MPNIKVYKKESLLMNELDFASLLCSRLCHDLISPVGAISNGIEILGDEDDEAMRIEVMKLLESSANQTSNRLKFYRLAFGAAGGIGAMVPIRDARNAAIALFDGSPINLTWNAEIGELDKSAVKLLLNTILVASESLIRGGDLMVGISVQADKVNLEVTVRAERLIFQDKAKAMICGETTDVEMDPKIAPAYLASNVAKHLNSKIEFIDHNENSFTLTAKV